MIDVLLLVYVGISLVMGGLAAAVVISDQSRSRDWAWEALCFGLYMGLLWPLLVALTAVDWVVSRRKKR